MIEKLLNRLGYYKVETTDDILNLYTEKIDSLEIGINPEEEMIMFKELKGIENLLLWLDAIIAGDIKNHFGAVNEKQRDNIRGMMKRFIDFKRKIVNSDQSKSTKISGIRYGN